MLILPMALPITTHSCLQVALRVPVFSSEVVSLLTVAIFNVSLYGALMSLTRTLERSENQSLSHPDSHSSNEESSPLGPTLDLLPAPPRLIPENRGRFVKLPVVLYCAWIVALVSPNRIGALYLHRLQWTLRKYARLLRKGREIGTHWLLDAILYVLLSVLDTLLYLISRVGWSYLDWYGALWPVNRFAVFLLVSGIATPDLGLPFWFGLGIYLPVARQVNRLVGNPRWFRDL